MATFKNNNGVEWSIELDGPSIEKIHEALGVNIASEDGAGVLSVCENGVSIVRACWILCEIQARKNGISAEQFGRAMNKGEVIEEAEQALRDATLGFIRPRLRAAATAVWQSQDEVTKATVEATMEKATDPKTKAMLVDAVKSKMTETLAMIVKDIQTSGSHASDSPDTSDAAPAE